MSNKEFNDHMDGYLDSLRKSKPKSMAYSSKKKKDYIESVPPGISSSSVYIIKKPKTFLQKFVDYFTLSKEEDFEEHEREELNVTLDKEQEFEQEYDEIAEEEKQTSFFQRIVKFFSSPVEEEYQDLDDESKLTDESNSRFEKSKFNTVSHEDDWEEATEGRTSVWRKMLSFFGITVNDSEEPEDVQMPIEEENISSEEYLDLKQDFKRVAVITTNLAKQLPKKQFQLFKESSDFIEFKEILRKHAVIKEPGHIEEPVDDDKKP